MVRFHEVSLDLCVSFTGAMAIAKRQSQSPRSRPEANAKDRARNLW